MSVALIVIFVVVLACIAAAVRSTGDGIMVLLIGLVLVILLKVFGII